ncbi:MAG: phosphonate ABC transporter, permease protein PhnE [Nitriliruptoraceae bacterium]
MATPTSTAPSDRRDPDPGQLSRIDELSSPWPRITGRRVLTVATLVGAVAWSVDGSGFSAGALADGLPNIADFLARMWPPDFSQMGRVFALLMETLQMAIIGTILGSIGSLLLAFAAADNIASRPVYLTARFLLNILRSIPELVFALIFVSAVGLGPFAGIMALALGSFGTVGKIYAEAIEAIDPKPVEALQAVGANKAQTIAFAMLPQASPLLASYTLLLWEGNVRAATILGLVGAGGIGLELTTAMRMYDFGHLMAIVLSIVVMVTLIDRLSAYLRGRLT